ncbi:MAG TPA: GAF domain-containing protein [Solirubrobacterales bacterium]|nr:GAF domain-containing protein [Solirubrobacterales bacterium]
MTEPVALESIMACFGGLIPSPFATCSPDGVPNVTYMSVVQYVDSDRVALSRQFFNKTRANLDANPRGMVRVVDPTTLAQYDLDLEFLHSEAQGQAFEAMRASLEAIASQTGMAGVFRLRGVDVHRVLRCAQVGGRAAGGAEAGKDQLLPLEELSRRLAGCRDYEDATAVALEALEDLFGFAPATLLVRDPQGERLFAVSGNGHAAAAAGAEVAVGEGVIGTAAASAQVVCVPNLTRSRVMQEALRAQLPAEAAAAEEIPLPGLPGAQSVAAVPIEAGGVVTGVLYLESERAGTFGPHNQRLLRIVGRHLGAVLRGLDAEEEPGGTGGRGAPVGAGSAAGPGERSVAVTYYGADDSVFVDDAYVIKGAAGRILWKMLRERAALGRVEFTNRELRLDEGLALPAGANNLEARLLMLRKRLAGGDFPIGLARVGRGRLELRVEGPLRLKQK